MTIFSKRHLLFDYAMSGLMLTFRANPKHLIAALGEKEVRRVRDATPVETPERILAMLATRPGMSLAEVAVAIGKSTRAVERAAAKLVEQGRLRFVGPRKGGQWEVLK